MLAKDFVFPLFSAVIALLCLQAARLSWRYAVLHRGKPDRRILAMAGVVLMVSLGVMDVVGAMVEVIFRPGEQARLLDWFWLGADILVPLFFLMLMRSLRLRDGLEAQLAAAAEHDPLTGLPNRAGFGARALAAVQASRQRRVPVVVALLDIDHFKSINDGWGHAAGDAALRGVAQATRPAMREQDVLGRIGGEEFAMILPGVDLESALPLVERLRTAIREGVPHPGAPDRLLTLSAGLATIEGEGVAALEAAMHRADEALYAAKAAGRDRAFVAALAA
ncbi:GGDEF domain-containing protein [Roseococcus sp.]|uniref:GGDEF domain-containing protein n=1 Tax=Roseococcus sp. TaxID=2109646 RepID=UPI003BAB98A8